MSRDRLRICLVSAEAAPFAKVGGLGDFTPALTRAVGRAGHDVRLFLPAYDVVDWRGRESGVVEFLRSIPVDMGGRWLEFTARYAYLPGISVQVYLIDCPELYHRGKVYTDHEDEAVRFGFLCRAAIECCQRMGWSPQIFHVNDWHAALVPIYLRSSYRWDQLFAASRHLLTIHNIGYQGVFGTDMLPALGLRDAASLMPSEDLDQGRINLLRAGIVHADVISTVSPTHAREIQTPQFGMGLEGLLRLRGDRLVGILNGVDYDEWDPARDVLLPRHYSVDDLRGKAQNKRLLLKDLSLPFAARTPLIGMISRLVHQKGIDLLREVLPAILRNRSCRLVVLGSGDRRYEAFFQALQHEFPHKMCFYRGYHNALAHRIEAASDIYLMPSLYEPCGLNQMYSLRYGAVPVVRRTGGLADAVEAYDSETRKGTGFLFDAFEPKALHGCLEQALRLYQKPRIWRQLVRNGMLQDFSWSRQVERYIELYRWLAG